MLQTRYPLSQHSTELTQLSCSLLTVPYPFLPLSQQLAPRRCHVAPGCQTLASPTVASTTHFFARRRCSTPTRVPKPRAATGNDSTPPQNPAPISPSCYYHITAARQAHRSLDFRGVGRGLAPAPGALGLHTLADRCVQPGGAPGLS